MLEIFRLPPHLRAILKHVDQAVDRVNSRADDRSESANESQQKVITAIQSIADEFKSYQTKQEEAEAAKNYREKLTIGSLLVTAVITFALAIIAALQWLTFEKQWETLEKLTALSRIHWVLRNRFREHSFPLRILRMCQ
jgi:hypothetical protein